MTGEPSSAPAAESSGAADRGSQPHATRRRLSVRLARICIVVAFLVGSILSAAQLYLDFSAQNRALDATITRVLTAAEPSAWQAAYDLDDRLARGVTEGLMVYEFVVDARILDDTGTGLASHTRPIARSRTRWITKRISDDIQEHRVALHHPDKGDVDHGTLVVVIDRDRALSAFFGRSLFVFASGLVRNLLLAGVLFVLFHLLLTKPLVQLAGRLSEIDPASPNPVEIPSPAGHESDELGLLSRSATRLVAASQRHLAEQLELESRLARAQKLEAVGTLAGGIAHDFNNLVTAILANVSLARQDGAGAAVQRRLDRIEEAAQRSAELTKRLLTFSRRELVEAVPLDLADELAHQRPLIAPLIRDDVSFVANLDPAAGVVRLSRGHVSQILMNLVSNAVDAMPSGGELQLSARRAESHPNGDPGPFAVLGVHDNGVGMTDSVLANVVEPFYTTKPVGRGTGLGLATVYGIAKGAGGSLVLDSHPDRGTTVEVWLPICDEPAVPREAPSGKHRWLLKGKVLLVEDEPAVLEATGEMLRRAGLEVTEALNGREAQALVDRGVEFDVVVTDAVMPHMGGVELLRQLRSAGGDFGAVLCSGYAADLVRADLEEVGATFLAKPYTEAAIREAVGNQLPQRPSKSDAVVLIADDKPLLRVAVADALKKDGYEVIEASDGLEAVRIFEQHGPRIDVVILDRVMPRMGGEEALAGIRALRSDVPVLMASGFGEVDRGGNPASTGPYEFIAKPFSIPDLLAAVRRLADGI